MQANGKDDRVSKASVGEKISEPIQTELVGNRNWIIFKENLTKTKKTVLTR